VSTLVSVHPQMPPAPQLFATPQAHPGTPEPAPTPIGCQLLKSRAGSRTARELHPRVESSEEVKL
jgi:hypothetical protein